MSTRSPCKGCLLIGSCPWDSTETALSRFAQDLPGRLHSIPDGETGKRNYFTMFQWLLIQQHAPDLASQWEDNKPVAPRDFTHEQVEKGLADLRAKGFDTEYDTAALDSYAKFKKMKQEGKVPASVKFQVCLPALGSVIPLMVERDFRPGMEVIYEEALFKALRRIQDEIPHDQLAIQLDLAADTALWEGVLVEYWGKEDAKKGVAAYVAKMIAQVDDDVDLGMHNCYGDMEHKHWMEPTSLAAVTERVQALYEQKIRPLQWFHVPVPLSAMDKLDTYFTPLKPVLSKFRQDGTQLYLGLVHPNDLEGTWERIEAARKALGEDVDFGVAAECGLGRTPEADIKSIMKISTAVSKPVTQAHADSSGKPVAEPVVTEVSQQAA